MQPRADITLALHHAHAARPPLLELVKDAMGAASPAASVRAAPDVPEPDDEGPLYVARRKIYPQRVKGTYRTIKWIVLFVTLGVSTSSSSSSGRRRSTTSPGSSSWRQ
jgi:hypothetical protein